MEKKIRLADIYIKIYNKQPLLMEDLAFLAKYDRECFEKTCRNLIYNMPEAKDLMQPAQAQEDAPAASGGFGSTQGGAAALLPKAPQNTASREAYPPAEAAEAAEVQQPQINTLLDNLKKMEWQEMPIPDLDAGKVKNLLGSLYMELLFPHNDKYRYFSLEDSGQSSIFNRKV